jgi:hypothetical protein
MPFASGTLAEINATSSVGGALLNLIGTPRVKFAQPCTYGWTLADPPSTMSAAARRMFQLPLDQGYAFFSNNKGQQQQR